ncbi:MAG: hypothetical protein HN589_06430 [Proteobacteria bacterium]|nr:hypothetical protein [Pseudomonadota bacterium]
MKWTDAGSGPNTGLFKDNCVQWSGETVYLDVIADKEEPIAKNDVPADTGARDTRECAPIMNKYDPYGTFVCINETKCQEEGYTWMDFNTASESGFPGCSTESPSIIAARANATFTEFSGNRSSCSSESAWQASCQVRISNRGGPIDLAPCFALKDTPKNIEGLTPSLLGILQENSYQCQTAMPLCRSNDMLDRFGKSKGRLKLPAGDTILGIDQSAYTVAVEGFIDWGTKGVYECTKSSIEQDLGSMATSCASILTKGVSDYLFIGADLLISLLEREPKCEYNTDVSSSGDMLSLEKHHDFGDWGMYPRSVHLECGISEEICISRGGYAPCNMGGNSCEQPSESAQAILRCEERHGEPREGVDCRYKGRHGKETKDAEERCPETWRDVDKCQIDDEILYGKKNEGSLYPWWPLQEGATHPWANKDGFCENNNYDDEGYCVGYDKCAQDPWHMSENQRKACDNADSKVSLMKLYSDPSFSNTPDMCDSQPGIQPLGC